MIYALIWFIVTKFNDLRLGHGELISMILILNSVISR